jgi:hypothetical protein
MMIFFARNGFVRSQFVDASTDIIVSCKKRKKRSVVSIRSENKGVNEPDWQKEHLRFPFD